LWGARRSSEKAPEVDPRWYETFFGRDFLELAADHDEQLTRAEVAFLEDKLRLERGARVLDLACGHGRHAVELAARGFRMTGLDISEPSIAVARERAARRGVDLDLMQLDMRDLELDSQFSAAYNFCSAFGYFPREEEDQRLLERVRLALAPGGSFLIDTMNDQWLVRNFEPHARRKLANGTVLTEERSYNASTRRSSAIWTLRRTDGSRSELRHSMRIYSCPELCGMLGQAGLTVDGIWGGADGSKHGVDKRRSIVRARKDGAAA